MGSVRARRGPRFGSDGGATLSGYDEAALPPRKDGIMISVLLAGTLLLATIACAISRPEGERRY